MLSLSPLGERVARRGGFASRGETGEGVSYTIMRRRTVLKLVALTAIAGPAELLALRPDEGAAWTAADYKLEYFTPAENQLLDQVMELIIPADGHSGGAHAAKVSLFADRLIATGSDAARTEWRDGLGLLQDAAAKSSVADALALAAAGEANPRTGLERFFVTLKQMTANGYYTSEIGIHQDLEYQGNTYLAEFPGCPHPEPH